MPPKNLQAALAYARRGWYVFPLRPKSKTPLTLHGFRDASIDTATIEKWWNKNLACGVGIATGSRSGILVLDIDPRNDGDETLQSLELEYGELPETIEARTGGGGRHLVFKCPEGVWPSAKNVWPGIDVKSDLGYIAAPYSIHPNGVEYTWLRGPRIPQEEGGIDPLPCPSWLLEALQRRKESRKEAVKRKKDTEHFEEGARNDALTSLAGTMRRRGMSHAAILAALLAENEVSCNPPLTENEVFVIAESVARYDPDEDASPSKISKEAKEGHLIQWADTVQMATSAEPEIQWILDGWVARNDCVLLYGPPGVGKSWITCDLAITCATGRPPFGYFNREGEVLKVLLVDEENTYEEVWRRVHRVVQAWEIDGKDLNGQFLVTHPCQGFTFANDSYVYALQKEVERLRPDIIIFDSVTALSGIKKEADAYAVRGFFHDKLYPLRSVCGSCIIAVHHTNKAIYQIEETITDAGLARGSIDMIAAPDAAILLKPYGQDDDKIGVHAAKIRRGKRPPNLTMRIIDGEVGGTRPLITANGTSEKDKGLRNTIQELLTDKPMTFQELQTWSSTMLGKQVNNNQLKKCLSRLTAENSLESSPDPSDKRKVYYKLLKY